MLCLATHFLFEGNAVKGRRVIGLFEPSNVDYWIFGHNHQMVPDFKIGKTMLSTNQLGYVEYGEHLNFRDSRLFEL